MCFIFIRIVLIIRGFTFLYTSWYVGNKKSFSVLVLLFVRRMITLILFTNLWIFIWGWDFLGVVSYILVINYHNQRSNNAGMITALSNRVGDTFMLIRLCLITLNGNWNSIINNKESFRIILILLFMTRITKRAQIPFCAWLPAAMAAPTPISALVHSSTLVTAGVYLVIRFNQNRPSMSLLITGILTTIIAGVNACNGFDFKKLIALSTLRQLGLMFIALGIGSYKLALYHLVCHGLVKALLFLSAGIIIHQSKRTQDLRLINGIIRFMPITSTCILFTSLTLSGLPFMTCYFSKETIIRQNFVKRTWILIRIYTAAILTINYRTRLIYRLYKIPTFWDTNNLREKNSNSIIPLLSLAPFMVLWGSSKYWFFIPIVKRCYTLDKTFTSVTWIILLLSLWIGYLLFSNKHWGNFKLNRLTTNLLFMPILRRNFINKITKIGLKSTKEVESSWSESFGAQGIYNRRSLFMVRTRNLYARIYIILICVWWSIRACLYSLYKA